MILATGSEVSLAIEVAKEVNAMVISVYCLELIDMELLDNDLPKFSLEAGSTIGWFKYVDYPYGIDSFGISAKIENIIEND